MFLEKCGVSCPYPVRILSTHGLRQQWLTSYYPSQCYIMAYTEHLAAARNHYWSMSMDEAPTGSLQPPLHETSQALMPAAAQTNTLHAPCKPTS